MEYRINIKRFNPEQDPKPHWEEYTVQADPDNLPARRADHDQGTS